MRKHNNKCDEFIIPEIHNSSWGFEGIHVIFRDELDKIGKCIHSDIINSDYRDTFYHDIIVENKDWERPVIQEEVKKFLRDIDMQKCCGLFLSQKTTITTKENYEINVHDGNVLVYVHCVNNDPEKIKIAIDIVDAFHNMLKNLDEESCSEENMNTISKEVTDHINVEYQNFLSKKNKTIKKKLLKYSSLLEICINNKHIFVIEYLIDIIYNTSKKKFDNIISTINHLYNKDELYYGRISNFCSSITIITQYFKSEINYYNEEMQARKILEERVGQPCPQCKSGKLRIDSNGYNEFMRCQSCRHVGFLGP